MITIILAPTTHVFAQRFQQMPEAKQKLFVEVIEMTVIESFTPHATYKTSYDKVNGIIAIIANGVSAFKKLDVDRFCQEITNRLVALKLDQFFEIHTITPEICPGDKILSPSSIINVNCHERLQTIFDIDEKAIPPEFLCTINKTIMGIPAYLTTNPKVFYEFSTLIEWISKNPIDPTTRDRILAPGILVNHSLKQKISSFIADYASGKDIKKYHTPTRDIGTNTDSQEVKATSTEERDKLRKPLLFSSTPAMSESKNSSNTPLLQVFEACKLADDLTKIFGKSLRRAANAGLNKEIEVLFSAVDPKNIIDLQDDNPESKNTALHFAINKLHISTVELLIKYNAKINIPNAQGITAEKLLKTSSDARLAKMVTGDEASVRLTG